MNTQPLAEGTRSRRRRAAERRWLTVAEAADYCRLKPRTIRQKITDGVLPAYTPRGSRLLRIDVRDLEDFMSGEGRVPAGHLANGKVGR